MREFVVAILKRALIAASAAAMAAASAAEEATQVGDVLDAREAQQDKAQASQARVADLDDATLAMLADYNTELDRLTDLEAYNANMRTLLESQAAERSRLQAELREIEVVKRALVPLMDEMIDVLEQFLVLDAPMLQAEREARLAAVRDNMGRSDIELAERYRRLIEAYQIEAEYGQSIEAYEGPLTLDDRQLTVDYLRVGRVGLYYMTLDRNAGGMWDPKERVWVTLSDADLDGLDFAIRVARKQAPPDLIPLPLWTPDRASQTWTPDEEGQARPPETQEGRVP